MKIKLEDKAVNYIQRKGGKLIIFKGGYSGCCVGGVSVPMLELGAPRRPLKYYDQTEINGVTIYKDKELEGYQGVAFISLVTSLWWKSLSLDYKMP